MAVVQRSSSGPTAADGLRAVVDEDERRRSLALAQEVRGTRDALRIGVAAVTSDDLTRAQELIRVRRGAFVLRDVHDAAGRDDRYRLRTRAVRRTRPQQDAASHHAALMLDGIATYGVDLCTIDVASAVKQSAVRGRLRAHPASGLPVALAGGWRLVDLPVAPAQVGTASGLVAGVSSMDAACMGVQVRGAERRRCTAAGASGTSRGPGRRPHRRGIGVDRREQDASTARRPRTGGPLPGRGSTMVDRGYEVVRLTWTDPEGPAEVARRMRHAQTRALSRRGRTP